MPLNPPELKAPSFTFEPIFLTDEDVEDLATFTGLAPDVCRKRVHDYSLVQLADAWRRADPKSPVEILDFYRSTDLYIWEQVQWHASASRTPYWQALRTLVECFPPTAGFRRVYDFGGGIGTDALYLASRGYEVTLVDVDGPSFRFAQHRFRRRGLQARFEVSHSTLPAPSNTYDIILCFDVFEHLPEPLEAVRRLVAALRPGGLIAQTGTFEDSGAHPCHLRKGIAEFSGLRWHIHLAGLGLRNIQGPLYRKTHGWERLVQVTRYVLWRLTGSWIISVGSQD